MHASKIYFKKFGNTKLVVKFVKAVDDAASRFVYFEHEPLRLLNGAASPKIFWYGFVPKIEDFNNYEYVIIMQYLEGVTLFDLLEGNFKIELNNYNNNQVLEKIKENTINSINLIHSVGISHNDLRDKNIIITKDLTVKIIDYGLSRTSNNVDSVNLKQNILKADSSNLEKKYNLRKDGDAIEYLISQIDNLIK